MKVRRVCTVIMPFSNDIQPDVLICDVVDFFLIKCKKSLQLISKITSNIFKLIPNHILFRI